MNNKQELTYIEKIKNLLDDHIKNVINLGNKINLFIQENDPSFNKLKGFKIDSSNSNEINANDESYLKQKLEGIKGNLENMKEELASNIYKPLSIFEDKINKYIKEYSNEDNSSVKDTKDMSLSDSFDGSLDFNIYLLSPYNSSYFQDYEESNKKLKELFPQNIDAIEKNDNNSGNMNFNSSSDKSSIQNSLFMCSIHADKPAVYICNKHCQKKFCIDCFSDLGFKSEHGELLKICERINRDSNSNISRTKDNFLAWIDTIFNNLFRKCSELLNTNRIPNLPNNQSVNILDKEEQKLFLDKIFDEHKQIQILNQKEKMPNEQILSILKSITLSDRIILQSAKINLNAYQIIEESAKFYISIYPHRNINNHEEFNKKISFPMIDKFPELNKNYIMDDNYVFLIVNEYLSKKNYNKNIFISEEKDVQKSIYILNNIYSLKKNYLIESCQINANKLDKKYDAIYFKSEKNDIIEGEKYFPPIGWFGIGLKNDKDPKRPIAYLTFNKILNKEPLKLILNEIIEKKNLEILEYQSPKREFDKRHWNKVGKGIYLFPNIERAEKYTGTFDINNKKYKIVLLVKVEKDKIKEPKHNKLGCWVVEKDYVKICRILFKEINKD